MSEEGAAVPGNEPASRAAGLARGSGCVRAPLGTVSTYDHLHQVLNLVRSIRESWPSAPEVFVGLVDGWGAARPGFDAGVTFVDLAREMPGFGWLAAKYDATELCCAAKPYLVRHVLDLGHRLVVYCDADQHFFGEPTGLLELAARHDVVVIPHTLAPTPEDDPWSRPSLGDIAAAGLMNAGLCTFRAGAETRGFLETWARLATGPGAFLPELGLQHEQNFFNWVLAFVPGVGVCRDERLNVAYWNLHERPLRWSALDGGSGTEWTTAGRPIQSFHYSGFGARPLRLTSHAHRTPVALDINVHALCRFLAQRLAGCGEEHYRRAGYAYGALEGVAIDGAVRTALKRMERHSHDLACDPGRWREDVGAVLTRLFAGAGAASVLPEPIERIRLGRPDLAALAGDTPLFPRRFLAWFAFHAYEEYPIARLAERFTPHAVHRDGAAGLAAEIAAAWPEIPAEQAGRCVAGDRMPLLRILDERAWGTELWRRVREGACRFPAANAALCLRLVHAARADLREAFPDPMGRDLGGFAGWVRSRFAADYEAPEAVAGFVETLRPTQSLARVLAYARLSPDLNARLRAGGLDRPLLETLLAVLPDEPGFTAEDLVVVDWWLEGDALPRPRPASPAAALAGLVRRGRTRATRPVRGLRDLVTPLTFPEDADGASPGRDGAGRDRAGLNVFGYFASPIGLGTASRGLARALGLAGYRTREILLTNTTMDAGLDLHHLWPRLAREFARNLVVTYPHIQCDVFEQFPASFFRGREQIAYVAWEQRDLHPEWARRLERFDVLTALSSFAAEAIRAATGRPVHAVPCVVDVDRRAAGAWGRGDFGIPGDAFAVGLVMDASSSLERKNPTGALRALVRAFAGRRDVFVVIKVTNGDRGRHRRAVAEAVAVLEAAGLRHRLETATLTGAQVHGLIGSLDLFVSLHRAEGFGYTLAEAMALGVPALATRYSGNLDFMSDGNSWLVECRETVVRRADGPFRPGTVWADPDLDDAADKCRAVFEQRVEAGRRAARARADVQALLSPQAVAARLRDLLA